MDKTDPSVRHAEYDASLSKWQRCADAYDGEDAIKARGTGYLPSLTKQKDAEYAAYKMRATFYGAMEKTVNGLCGAAVSREFEVELPPRIAYLEQNSTIEKKSFDALTQSVVLNQLISGRGGILIDRGALDNSPIIFVHYAANQIINWATSAAGELTNVVIEECVYEPDADNRFAKNEVTQYRELHLDNGAYGQRIWSRIERAQGQEARFVFEEIKITSRGKALNFIPFVFVNADGISPCISKPPLLALADLNISHYRNSADLEHGAHYTGLPTPWIAGYTIPEGEELKIGGSAAWVFSDPQAKAGYLEFTGQGLGAIEKLMESKKQMMAVLGARLLDSQKAAAESEGTLRMRNSADTFTLGRITRSVADALSLALYFAMRWEEPAFIGEIIVTPNTKFADSRISPQELTALLGALNSNAISIDTFLWNLQRGEMLRPDSAIDDEVALLDNAASNPNLPAPAVAPIKQEEDINAQ